MVTIPTSWMPKAKMDRIIFHWTAGTHKASSFDKQHYHILIEADGRVVRGAPTIDGNARGNRTGKKASHTLNCNTGSIGVSLCCMGGNNVRESPFVAGKWPLTRTQWEKLALVLADLCRAYDIPVTAKTVLSHAEVQATLGIKQRQKWDISRLAFDPSVKGAKVCGDMMRKAVREAMAGVTKPVPTFAEPNDGGEPDDPPYPLTVDSEPAPATDIETIQRRLKERGYHNVGNIDGKWGGATAGAIAAFKNDRHMTGEPVIDDALKAELDSAEAEDWTRPIAKARAEATPEQLAPKLPEVAAAKDAGWWAKVQAWGAGIGATIWGVGDYIREGVDKITPVREFLPDISMGVLVAAVLGVSFLIYRKTRSAEQASTHAYNEGART